MGKLSNSHIVKIGIVTADVEKTAAGFRAVFPEGPAPASQTGEHPTFTVEPYKEYRGQRLAEGVSLKVANVYTENFWFEIIQPVGDTPNPWQDFLDAHGTSVCWTSIHVDQGFEEESAALEELGFPRIWVEDKGYERYAYFDTTDVLGLLVEVKERLPK